MEATLRRLDDAADLLFVEAELIGSRGERAVGSVEIDDLVKAILRRHGLRELELHGRLSHDGGLYHGRSAATAGDAGEISTAALTQVRAEVLQLFSQAGARFSLSGRECS